VLIYFYENLARNGQTKHGGLTPDFDRAIVIEMGVVDHFDLRAGYKAETNKMAEESSVCAVDTHDGSPLHRA
jgi:hypothetical protein